MSTPVPLPTMSDLTRLLHLGLCDTLEKAKDAEALKEPYGRPKIMSVEDVEEKINEESSDSDSNSDSSVDSDSDSDSDASIDFTYTFGFNPLTHLGMFLKRSNPKNVAARALQRDEAIQFLKKRSEHSLRQLSVKDEIEGIVKKRITGIVQGPVVSLREEGKVYVWCKVFKTGRLVCEISKGPEKSPDDIVQFVDVIPGREGDPLVGVVKVENLQSDTEYRIKIGLETEDGAFRGIEGKEVVEATFKTLVDSDERSEVTVNVGSLGGKGFGGKVKEIAEGKARPLLLLGNVVPPKEMMAVGESGEAPKGQLKLLRDHMSKAWTGELGAAASSLPLFCAFNDATKGSDDLLLNEELALSKSSSKSKSKRRQTQSQGTTPSVKAFSEYFPVELVKKPTRHMYDSVPLSIHAEMYLLDTRCGFLGGNQAKWLTGRLESSSCKWKVIAAASSSAYSRQIDQTVALIPHTDEEELKAQAEAASVIQMKAKEKKEKKDRSSSKKKKIGGAWLDVEKFILEKKITGVVLLTSECRSFGVSKTPWGWEVSVGTFVEEQHPEFSSSGEEQMPLEDGGGYIQLKVSEEGGLTVKRCGGKSDGLEVEIKGEEANEGEENKEGEDAEEKKD
ncbi:hypothetical protein TrVE_jg8775 [Triparma verrucosa]|uniref:Uncharacterized protein n=1 Tax=Triparma verrucosa TaxID=1606542 RepID=A0A9W6ZF63_9STRA|nr:hypothetical protein TrVE_jg8775 [Triparma verrucosa]